MLSERQTIYLALIFKSKAKVKRKPVAGFGIIQRHGRTKLITALRNCMSSLSFLQCQNSAHPFTEQESQSACIKRPVDTVRLTQNQVFFFVWLFFFCFYNLNYILQKHVETLWPKIKCQRIHFSSDGFVMTPEVSS